MICCMSFTYPDLSPTFMASNAPLIKVSTIHSVHHHSPLPVVHSVYLPHHGGCQAEVVAGVDTQPTVFCLK